MRFVASAVAAAIALGATVASAQESAVVSEGVLLTQQGDFEEAVQLLEPAARELARAGASTELSRAYLYLSIAYLGLSEEQKARARFIEALNADRSTEWSPEEFPPKVIQFFERALSEALESGQITTESEAVGAPDAAPPPQPISVEPLVFRKVDYFRQEGGEEKKYDARLVLNPARSEILISDEDDGKLKALYARIPYAAVTGLEYERSAHRRKTALFLSRSKKHWLTITFEGVPELPNNFVYMRLDKSNYRRILTAIEAQTGIEPAFIEER